MQLYVTPAAAQACWQEMKNAGLVNVRPEPVPADVRARREYIRKGDFLLEELVGELRSFGMRSGTKKAGACVASFHVFGVYSIL